MRRDTCPSKSGKLAVWGKRALIFLAALLVSTSGCSWRATEQPPTADSPVYARLVLKNGTVIEVKEAFENRGVIAGFGKRVETGWRKEATYWDVPVSVSMKDIREIKTKQTGLLPSLVIIGAVVGAAYIVFSQL